MSVDPKSSPSAHTISYTSHVDIQLQDHKKLQASLSHADHRLFSRHSLKPISSDDRHSYAPAIRTRAKSTIEAVLAEQNTESTSLPKKLNTLDNRQSKRLRETKLSTPKENHDEDLEQQKSLSSTTYSNSLFSHGLHFNKHHQKFNTKAEATKTSTTINNDYHMPASNSSTNSSDTIATKINSSSKSHSSVTYANASQLPPLHYNERKLTSSNEDSVLSPPSSSSFILDEAPTEPRSAGLTTLNFRASAYVSDIYLHDFYDYFHTNYCGEFDDRTPFIASLRLKNCKTALMDTCEACVIIRTLENNYIETEEVTTANENNILRTLFLKANAPPIHQVKAICDPKANEKIFLFDKTNDERCNCKVGIIYQHANQIDEQDIFNNDNLSNDMLHFLNQIATRVNLKGFQKYRGDLDTKNSSHGEYSYHTEYKHHEIMFNVAPMITSINVDERYTERKSLVGNAFVCVVFQEKGAEFSPDLISGRVTQIYITVQPCMKDEQLHYKISIWRRNYIKENIHPAGGILIADDSFSIYFLTLLLNSIDAAIKSSSLHSLVFKQRQRLKTEELTTLTHLLSLGPIPEIVCDTGHVPAQLETHGVQGTDNFSSSSTLSVNDTASSHNGRLSPAPTKKKGFSKLFGVFTGRSMSATAYTPLVHPNSDGISNSVQISSSFDSSLPLSTTPISGKKDSITRLRSTKPGPAPVISSKTLNQSNLRNSRILSGMPAITPSLDSPTENNQINTAALDIVPRSRSNSSPEDTAHATKTIPRIPLSQPENPETISSEESETPEETSSDSDS